MSNILFQRSTIILNLIGFKVFKLALRKELMTVKFYLFLKELNHHTGLNQIQSDGASDPLTRVNLPLVSRSRFLTAEIDGRVLWLSPAHEAV